jgi:hypothetical protein
MTEEEMEIKKASGLKVPLLISLTETKELADLVEKNAVAFNLLN